jgi:hypothetical protein
MRILASLLAAAALALAPCSAFAKIVRQVDKTFAVSPGGTLRVQTMGGDVRVATADTAEVRVTARQTFRTNSESEADEILAAMTFRIEQQGNDVVAEAKSDRKGGWFGQNRVAVDFTVMVPRQFNVDLVTSGGDIRVGDLTGTVKARTSGGDLEFARIAGDVEGRTSGGDVSLAEGTARADLSTSGGDITVTRAGGPTKVSTSGGDIRLEAVAELLGASTSGGTIVARLLEAPRRDVELSSSGGDIRVTLPKAAAFVLDAGTSGGNVDAAGLTLTLEKGGQGKSRLSGSVNGGGPRLRLRTSGGDIKVRAE